MHRWNCLVAIAASAIAAAAQAVEPAWSVPKIPGASEAPFLVPPKTPYRDPSLPPLPDVAAVPASVPANMQAVVRIGRQWGTVTSVLRSVEHNRKVGGVPNSYHLSGRAIDIARRAGVSHADIAFALRKAGFRPIESLDEGDHSHFAFANAGDVRRAAAMVKPLFQLAVFDVNGSVHARMTPPAPRGAGN